jgi:hypothetical protein
VFRILIHLVRIRIQVFCYIRIQCRLAWIRNPDQDTDPLAQLNSNPIWIRIRDTAAENRWYGTVGTRYNYTPTRNNYFESYSGLFFILARPLSGNNRKIKAIFNY